jgi:hypothetical protein
MKRHLAAPAKKNKKIKGEKNTPRNSLQFPLLCHREHASEEQRRGAC